jgi:hypothetical protein
MIGSSTQIGLIPMNTKEKSFSETFDEALFKAEMIREMAIEDGWKSLDECLEQAPGALDILLRHADAALRALKRIREREKGASPSKI